MSEQPNNQAQFNEEFSRITSNEHIAMDGQRPSTQAEIDLAHKVAISRDHHETNVARSLASMRLVEKAMAEHPEDIGGQLRQELLAAVDSQAPAKISTYERTRNMRVASDAHDVYSQQKQIEDNKGSDLRSPNHQPEGARARKAADFTIHKLNSFAFNSKHEADKAEDRVRQGSW